ncbi:Reverse transcriptase domain-containing protein [Aphis craccivora]|uniref:Reverse transcriptase domain-containing protein n=1 Tax=Aphis craccivora TaxID=307492 RepID=A0A6G0VN71_APHCR|nr:Reverse transcriptase domain-containing protein [Aphis craccivora]
MTFMRISKTYFIIVIAHGVTCRYVNEIFSQFHDSVTEMEQQFNTMNNYFATVSDKMLLEKPVIEDSWNQVQIGQIELGNLNASIHGKLFLYADDTALMISESIIFDQHMKWDNQIQSFVMGYEISTRYQG